MEGDPRLNNIYGVIPVNPSRHPHVKHAESMRFVEWLVSRLGRAAIADFTIGGEQVFHPMATPSGATQFQGDATGGGQAGAEGLESGGR